MEYIHVRNLEKYHPGYKDRQLSWAKIFINMADGDPDMEMVTNEIDWARLIKMILLELRAKKPLPNDNGYWLKKGFDLKKRPMSLTLKMLHSFLEVRYESVTQSREEKKRKEESREEENSKVVYHNFEAAIVSSWNKLSERHPSIPKVREVTPKRRTALKQRFTQKTFLDFPEVLKAIEEQPFLLGKNDRNWTVSFDWIIHNDTNYVKVLERKYKNNGAQADNLKARLGL